MLLDRECHFENHYGRIVSRRMWILVDTQKCSRRNLSFRMIYKFWLNQSNPCKKITGLSIATGLVLAKSPGNPPAVWVLTGSSVQFGSRTGQRPDPLCLGGVVTRTGHKPTDLARFIIQHSLNFANSELWLQGCIWVMIVSHYDVYVNDAVLDALSPPILQSAIWSLFVVSLRKTPNHQPCSTATQRIVIVSHIGEWEVKEHLKLHLLRIYHIVIRS